MYCLRELVLSIFQNAVTVLTASSALAWAWLLIRNNTVHLITQFTPEPGQPHTLTMTALSQKYLVPPTFLQDIKHGLRWGLILVLESWYNLIDSNINWGFEKQYEWGIGFVALKMKPWGTHEALTSLGLPHSLPFFSWSCMITIWAAWFIGTF